MSLDAGNKFSVKVDGTYATCAYNWIGREFSDAEDGYVASDTAQGTQRSCGNPDYTGAWEGFGNIVSPKVFPGSQFAFVGAIGKTPSPPGTAKKCVSLTARCMRYGVVAAISQKEAKIFSRTEFGNDQSSAPTYDATILEDTAVPDVLCASDAGLYLGGTLQENVEFWSLLFWVNGKPYVDSSTGGRYMRGGTLTKFGDLDWTLQFRRKFGDFDELKALSSIVNVQAYVDGSRCWDLDFGRIVRRFDIEHNRLERRGEPITATVEIRMMTAGTTAAGSVVDPGGLQRWPW